MNNVIKPNTSIKILSQEHLGYVKRLAHQQGFERYVHLQSDSGTKWISFYDDMTYTQCGSNQPYFEEIFIPMPNSSPTPPFKLRNANHPAVREWLKSEGCEWNGGGDLTDQHLMYNMLKVDANNKATIIYTEVYDSVDVPELELTLNLAVTSWEVSKPIDKDKLERMERIKAIEAELDKLKQMDGQLRLI